LKIRRSMFGYGVCVVALHALGIALLVSAIPHHPTETRSRRIHPATFRGVNKTRSQSASEASARQQSTPATLVSPRSRLVEYRTERSSGGYAAKGLDEALKLHNMEIRVRIRFGALPLNYFVSLFSNAPKNPRIDSRHRTA
jgi:hypothetical protein